MGLFDFFKKNRQGAAPARETSAPQVVKNEPPAAKRPETYGELVDDLLNNTDRAQLYEDCRLLSRVFSSVKDLGARYDMMSEILEKALETPRAEVTYEFLGEHTLGQYRSYLGERDPTYVVPLEKLDRFNEAVAKLYRSSGEKARERFEKFSMELYNIPCCAVRKLFQQLMDEDEGKRKKILAHLEPINNEGALYCLLEYIVIHMDDPSDAQRKEIRDFIRDNLHIITLCNTGEIISDTRVNDVPEFFRRIYLKICGREGDEELAARFCEFWES